MPLKQNYGVDPSCLNLQFRLLVLWRVLFWHTIGLLLLFEYCSNATTFLSTTADHVCLLMTKVHSSSNCFFQLYNGACHENHIISNKFLEHAIEFLVLQSTPQSGDVNPIEYKYDLVEWWIYVMNMQPTNQQQLWWYLTNMYQDLCGMFLRPWLN